MISKAAGLPRAQLGSKMFAGCEWLCMIRSKVATAQLVVMGDPFLHAVAW